MELPNQFVDDGRIGCVGIEQFVSSILLSVDIECL